MWKNTRNSTTTSSGREVDKSKKKRLRFGIVQKSYSCNSSLVSLTQIIGKVKTNLNLSVETQVKMAAESWPGDVMFLQIPTRQNTSHVVCHSFCGKDAWLVGWLEAPPTLARDASISDEVIGGNSRSSATRASLGFKPGTTSGIRESINVSIPVLTQNVRTTRFFERSGLRQWRNKEAERKHRSSESWWSVCQRLLVELVQTKQRNNSRNAVKTYSFHFRKKQFIAGLFLVEGVFLWYARSKTHGVKQLKIRSKSF